MGYQVGFYMSFGKLVGGKPTKPPRKEDQEYQSLSKPLLLLDQSHKTSATTRQVRACEAKHVQITAYRGTFLIIYPVKKPKNDPFLVWKTQNAKCEEEMRNAPHGVTFWAVCQTEWSTDPPFWSTMHTRVPQKCTLQGVSSDGTSADGVKQGYLIWLIYE